MKISLNRWDFRGEPEPERWTDVAAKIAGEPAPIWLALGLDCFSFHISAGDHHTRTEEIRDDELALQGASFLEDALVNLLTKYPKLGDRALSRLSGIAHTGIGNVRKALANPKDKKAYDAFKEHWEGFLRMDDKWQVALAEEYEVQLRDLLELLEIAKAA